MTRPAELESRRLSSSAGRVIVSRSSGAPELLNLDYRAHFQHISRRRHMQVRGEFSHMGCPWAVRAAVRPLRSEPERRLLDPLAVEALPTRRASREKPSSPLRTNTRALFGWTRSTDMR